jgi:recombination associated protein RdgC
MRDLVELLYAYRFLGREFLAWLWFKSEAEADGLIKVRDQEPVMVAVGDKMVLETGDGEYRETLVLQGSHSEHREARLGLQQGKLPEEMHLRLSRGQDEWQLNPKAATREIKGLKSKNAAGPQEDDEDQEAFFFDQMYQVEAVSMIIDGLFREFLQVRLSPAWEQEELPHWQDWLEA